MILFPYDVFEVEVAMPPADLGRALELYIAEAITSKHDRIVAFSGWHDGERFFLQRSASYHLQPLGFSGEIVPAHGGSRVRVRLYYRWLLGAVLTPALILGGFYLATHFDFLIGFAVIGYPIALAIGMIRYWWVLALHKPDLIVVLKSLPDKLAYHDRSMAVPGHRSLDYPPDVEV